MKTNQPPLYIAGATVSPGSTLGTTSTLNVEVPVFISGYSQPRMWAGKESEAHIALDPLVRSVLAAYPIERARHAGPERASLPGFIASFF